jgi:hypothetical protein
MRYFDDQIQLGGSVDKVFRVVDGVCRIDGYELVRVPVVNRNDLYRAAA